MYLIVGLGNPGEQYANTRHNLGFMVVARLGEHLGVKTLKSKFSSFLTNLEFSGKKMIIAMPQTFMNRSGEAVAQIMHWHKIKPDHLILIYDDVDLPVGEVRIRDKGGTAGHKGVASVITHVGTQEFVRVRVGVGRETADPDIADYVLSKIPPGHMEKIQEAITKASSSIITIIQNGIEAASQGLIN